MAVGKGPLSSTAPLRTDARVMSAKLISTDMNELQYKAAATSQIPELPDRHELHDQRSDNKSNGDRSHLLRTSPFLISSPYNQEEHLIDLRKLPKNASLFAQALTTIRPTCENYACMPYQKCLNWDHVIESLRILVDKEEEFKWTESDYFLVEFRSKMRETASKDEQCKLD